MVDTAREIVKTLTRMMASRAPLDEVLEKAVGLLHQASPKFHWTGIYELFPDHVLRLGPFVGAPTNHVFICVGQGVCGSAVAQKRNMNIPDVSKESNYLACSEETKSELVVLIRKGERIFAQIDIDSHEFAAFDSQAENLVLAVAECLADAYAAQPTSHTERAGAPGPTAG
jgi:GAF domain-containing protein